MLPLIVSACRPLPFKVRLFREITNAVPSVILLQVSVVMLIVSLSTAAAKALRKLPLPLSLQLVTVCAAEENVGLNANASAMAAGSGCLRDKPIWTTENDVFIAYPRCSPANIVEQRALFGERFSLQSRKLSEQTGETSRSLLYFEEPD